MKSKNQMTKYLMDNLNLSDFRPFLIIISFKFHRLCSHCVIFFFLLLFNPIYSIVSIEYLQKKQQQIYCWMNAIQSLNSLSYEPNFLFSINFFLLLSLLLLFNRKLNNKKKKKNVLNIHCYSCCWILFQPTANNNNNNNKMKKKNLFFSNNNNNSNEKK